MTRIALALSLGLFALAACEQEAPGYRGTVCLTVRHHGLAVEEATVYHRAGGSEFPGYPDDMSAAYDQEVFTGLSARACFDGLGLGRHYFAALAYDPLIRDSVLGSQSIELTVRQREWELELPVSETH